MPVKITITKGKCQGGYHQKGDEFIVDNLAPPLCLGAWSSAAPYVTTLLYDGNFPWEKEKGTLAVHCADPKGITMELRRIDSK